MHFIFILAYQPCSDTVILPVPYTDRDLLSQSVLFAPFFPRHTASIFHWKFWLHTVPAVHVRRRCLLFISVNHGPCTQHLPFTRRLQERTHASVPPWQNDWQAALVKLHQGGWGSRRACVCISYLSVTRSCPTPDENSLSLQFQHLLTYSAEGKDAEDVPESCVFI